MKNAPIARAVVANRELLDLTPAEVSRAFRALLRDGAQIRPAGLARRDPQALLRKYPPRYAVDLFDTRFFLTDVRQNPELRYFAAYVWQGDGLLWPRIFYKDLSLIWRAASHFVDRNGEFWIGKGDVTIKRMGDEELVESLESTTDLPLEIQDALEEAMKRAARVRRDERILGLILRNAPAGRIEPYRDFSEPRRKAAAERRNLVHGGRSVARFRRKGDPGSLVFAAGYEPDFDKGVLARSASKSALYGGKLERFRILSKNGMIQYLFFSGPHHTWIIPPQALTTELSSYGVRTIDVVADDDLFVPGYEYHFMDESEDPPKLYSQIPKGYAGPPSRISEDRASAAPWLDALPVVQEFRRKVLGRRK